MTSPKNTIATMVRNRIQSVRNLAMLRLRVLGQYMHQSLELAAPVLETIELIETGAGGSEQHGVTGFGARVRLDHRSLKGTRAKQWNRAAQLGVDLVRRRAD